MTRPAKLTITLAYGFALELADQTSAPDYMSGRIAATLLMPAQPGRATRDSISTTYADPGDCHTFRITDCDPWVIKVASTYFDLDSAEQAQQAGEWISACAAAYAQWRSARMEGIAA